MSVREDEPVDLRLDVLPLDSRPVLNSGHVDLVVECPMFPTMALFFILDMCSAMMMLKLPVVVMKMSAVSSTSSMGATLNPSMQAWRAQIGSISDTITFAP